MPLNPDYLECNSVCGEMPDIYGTHYIVVEYLISKGDQWQYVYGFPFGLDRFTS